MDDKEKSFVFWQVEYAKQSRTKRQDSIDPEQFLDQGPMLQNFFGPYFCNKLECLLDQAWKACQGQILKLIMKIRKLQM